MRAPASGERSALVGLVPQYEIAAGLVLQALTNESLEWLALLDPQAGRLDDFQLATPGQLDAFQVKWSQAGGQVAWGAMRPQLVDLVRDRRGLGEQHPDRHVLGHLFSDLVASRSRMSQAPRDQQGASLASAVAQLLIPATRGVFKSAEQLPGQWRWLWRDLAEACGLSDQELLTECLHVRIELGQSLPSQTEVPGRNGVAYQRDLGELVLALLPLATDSQQRVRLSKQELLARLGEKWQRRLDIRSVHEFPGPIAYQPVGLVAERLLRALDQFRTGYVALIGSPGSGKSTLLTHELRGRDDVIARYYAYVPGQSDIGSTRAAASSFLHDLVLTLERRGLSRGSTPVDFDVESLSIRLEQRLHELGVRYQEEGQRAIILVDGLDHVERERNVEQSLLRYLPRKVPEGVLFVVGSQTVRMLHADICGELEEPGRTIKMAGLDRSAVASLARDWGVSADADRLWHLSDGHPLILTYLLQELRGLRVDEQNARLVGMPTCGGDVTKLYLRLWASIEEDEQLVELLALACRMRGAVDLAWLRHRGQPSVAVRRLTGRLSHLFRHEQERWHFFHESFRLFLQDRTSRLAGDLDLAEDRRFHEQLASMCRATPMGEPQAWDLLFHLAGAHEHAAVLNAAKPAFFRAQILALRPLELVAADIRMAARSLADVQDPSALVRLVISAAEVSQRTYQLPDREKFLSLLVRTGRWRIAIEHMEAERERFGEEDSRTARLHISLLLCDTGLYEEARRVFQANEPLELLAGRAEAPRLRRPHKLLVAWARAASVLSGPDAILDLAAKVQLPLDAPEAADAQMPAPRVWILAAAADELHARRQILQSDRLLAALEPDQPEHQSAWLWLLSERWHRGSPVTPEVVDFLTHRLNPEAIEAEERVTAAEGLWRAGHPETARIWLDGIAQPELKGGHYGDYWAIHGLRYRLNRMLAALGDRSSPEDLVPLSDSDPEGGLLRVARLTIAVAQLEGRAWTGEQLLPEEVLASLRPMLRAFYRPSMALADVLARLLRVGLRHDRSVLMALWKLYEQRWDEKPERLRCEGHQVLLSALGTGVIARRPILERLRQLEEMVQKGTQDGQETSDLIELAETMLEAGLEDDAHRLLDQAISSTLAVYHSEDYQLSGWIDLLGPRLDGKSGAELVRWLAGIATTLRERASDVPTHDPARRLLLADGLRRPGHSWMIGARLEKHDIVNMEDRLALLLEAQINQAEDPLWWILLVEALVPIARDPPVHLLVPASQRAIKQHGRSWLQQRLRALLSHVDVEAPPHTRESWRLAAADCAMKHALLLADVGIPGELHPDRRPVRTRIHGGTDDAERSDFLRLHGTVESLLAGAHKADLSDVLVPWVEAVDLLADQMNLRQIEETAAAFSKSAHRLNVHLRLARRAFDLGAHDKASALAEMVLAKTEPRSWLRTWDGGPLLGALTLLAKLDPEGARDRAYRRLAVDASSESLLLSELAQDLPELLELFGVDDLEMLGREVENYLKVLFRNSDMPGGEESQGQQDDDAPSTLARSGVDLLSLPYRLAVTTAQRTLVASLTAGDQRVEVQLCRVLQGTDEELILRVLSVLEVALDAGARLSQAIGDALLVWTTAQHLGIRLASRRLAKCLGRAPDRLALRALPAVYTIVVPQRETPTGLEKGTPLGQDDLDVTEVFAETELQQLAQAGEVNLGILNSRVASIARRLAGSEPVDDDKWRTDSSPLGWSYSKPSVVLWEQAAARVAAELADAELLSGEDALFLSVGWGYEPALIATRPRPRPSAVVALPEGKEETWVSVAQWLDGLQGAKGRLAQSLPEGWIVVGEHTELRRLDREMPRERRIQTLGMTGRISKSDAPDNGHRWKMADIEEIPRSRRSTLVAYHFDPSFRGPSAWLTLHPRVAIACGWARDPKVPIGWRDEEGPMVQSFWWRSGWLDSTPWGYRPEEVGEGWLVLAQPRALARMAEVLGGELSMAWQVQRDFMTPGHSSRGRSGVRGLDI